MDNLWTTLIEESGPIISGPFRIPRQMLAEQEYDGHLSIHDEASGVTRIRALRLKDLRIFRNLILLYKLWGDDWFRFGCITFILNRW